MTIPFNLRNTMTADNRTEFDLLRNCAQTYPPEDGYRLAEAWELTLAVLKERFGIELPEAVNARLYCTRLLAEQGRAEFLAPENWAPVLTIVRGYFARLASFSGTSEAELQKVWEENADVEVPLPEKCSADAGRFLEKAKFLGPLTGLEIAAFRLALAVPTGLLRNKQRYAEEIAKYRFFIELIRPGIYAEIA